MKIYLPILFLIVFSGCKKDPDQAKYIPQEIKDYMYFKTGTWWVYEEITSHIRDSMYVTLAHDTVVTLEQSSSTQGGTYEFYEYFTHSSFNNCKYTIYCNTTWDRGGILPVFRGKSTQTSAIGVTIIMTNATKIGDKVYSPYSIPSYVTYLGLYDSLSINGSFFYKVKAFNDSKNITEGNDSTFFFIAKNIGIVRKTIPLKNEVWNLVNYKIEQE